MGFGERDAREGPTEVTDDGIPEDDPASRGKEYTQSIPILSQYSLQSRFAAWLVKSHPPLAGAQLAISEIPHRTLACFERKPGNELASKRNRKKLAGNRVEVAIKGSLAANSVGHLPPFQPPGIHPPLSGSWASPV